MISRLNRIPCSVAFFSSSSKSSSGDTHCDCKKKASVSCIARIGRRPGQQSPASVRTVRAEVTRPFPGRVWANRGAGFGFQGPRPYLRVSQQVLGGHHDEGFAELPVHLSPQHVEIVRGRGDVDDLPVVLLDLRVFKKVSVRSPKSEVPRLCSSLRDSHARTVYSGESARRA